MRTGVCPKCASETVFATSVRDVSFMLPSSASIFGMNSVNEVASIRYVCVSCGYYERYIQDRNVLNAIQNSEVWFKVD